MALHATRHEKNPCNPFLIREIGGLLIGNRFWFFPALIRRLLVCLFASIMPDSLFLAGAKYV